MAAISASIPSVAYHGNSLFLTDTVIYKGQVALLEVLV